MRLVPWNKFKSSSNFHTGRSKALLFCGSFLFVFILPYCLVCVLQPCGHQCWERADLLSLLYMTFCCVFVTFQNGVLDRCGTWLYRFLIFAFFLTLVCYAVLNVLSSFLQSCWGKEWRLLYFNCLLAIMWLIVYIVSSSRCLWLVCSVWLCHFLVILIVKPVLSDHSKKNTKHWFSIPIIA